VPVGCSPSLFYASHMMLIMLSRLPVPGAVPNRGLYALQIRIQRSSTLPEGREESDEVCGGFAGEDEDRVSGVV
jgi:hypothetical protein